VKAAMAMAMVDEEEKAADKEAVDKESVKEKRARIELEKVRSKKK